eukprot:6890546-Pyramimonas_sp.AAC.1
MAHGRSRCGFLAAPPPPRHAPLPEMILPPQEPWGPALVAHCSFRRSLGRRLALAPIWLNTRSTSTNITKTCSAAIMSSTTARSSIVR